MSIKYSKKLTKKSINKVIVSDKKLAEIKEKITLNFSRLKSQNEYEKMKTYLGLLGVNFEFPFFVIELSNNSKCLEYIEELCAIKQLEKQGLFVNLIIISSMSPRRNYNLKYNIANIDYEHNIVRLYTQEDLSAMQINMIKTVKLMKVIILLYGLDV